MEHAQVEKKLIRLNDGTQAMMSFEEVYYEYRNLLRNRVLRWTSTYKYDEIFQEAVIGLWQAYQKHNSVNGFSFGALALRIIDRRLVDYYREHKPDFSKKTYQVKSIVSMDNVIPNSKGLRLQDLVGKNETFTTEIVNNLVLRKLIKKLSEQSRLCIVYYLNGYKQAEITKIIAEIHHTSRRTISRKIQEAFEEFKELYLEEMAL